MGSLAPSRNASRVSAIIPVYQWLKWMKAIEDRCIAGGGCTLTGLRIGRAYARACASIELCHTNGSVLEGAGGDV